MPEHHFQHTFQSQFNIESLRRRLSRHEACDSLYPEWLAAGIQSQIGENENHFKHQSSLASPNHWTCDIKLKSISEQTSEVSIRIQLEKQRSLKHWTNMKGLIRPWNQLPISMAFHLERQVELEQAMHTPPHILIGGASGMVARKLQGLIRSLGWKYSNLVRRASKHDHEISYQPLKLELNPDDLNGIDTIVHLAGANIAGGKWNAKRKKKLTDSRILSTRCLVEAIKQCPKPPKTFICASGTGCYGNQGEQKLDEASPYGQGFLAELARDWEKEALQAKSEHTRVIPLRISMVLSRDGGALSKMKLPFSLGFGGRLGHGKQWMSWISLSDLCYLILHSIAHPEIDGPMNASSTPVRNSAFTKALGQALGRPTPFPAPAFILKLALGEMAEQLLLSSQRAIPKKAQSHHFKFQHDSLQEAFADIYPH